MNRKNTLLSAIFITLLPIQHMWAQEEDVPTTGTNGSESANILFETLSGNYEYMTLAEIKKILEKKRKLSQVLHRQLKIKEETDAQKRSTLVELHNQDKENAEVLRQLRVPFKP